MSLSQVEAGGGGAAKRQVRGGLIATAVTAFALPLAATVAILSLVHSRAPAAPAPAPTAVAVVATPQPPTPPTATPAPPTPAPPTPAPVAHPAAAPAPSAPRPAGPPPPPAYPVVGRLDASSVGVHLTVVSVGLDRHGAMDAPEGPLGSSFWHEGFWFRYGAVPGSAGTTTIAGHLDDTAGRPAAFWNIRQLHAGEEVTVTRSADGAVLRYRIVEADVWTVAQATTAENLQRIYGGGPPDGVARLTLITCTGHWTGHGYDHRFVAFATLEG